MNITYVILLIAALGGVGGVATSALKDGFNLPHFDQKARIWRPGWIGNVLTGAIAAMVVWGVYGAASTYEVLNGDVKELKLTVAQLLMSLVIGLSGSQILALLAEKNAEKIKSGQLQEALSELTK